MDIRIKSIYMKNFKGIAEGTIDFNGNSAEVYGDNATGKTSLFDAFNWVLFDKNSLGATDFEVKPIGLKRPEVEVSIVLIIDGKEIKLKKVLTEKWTKKRGDEFDTLTGHESKFWINDIEKKQSDYKAYLDSLVSEKTFKMLTSADYFLSQRKPDMRNILIEMAGGVSDIDIAGEDQQLKGIVSLMQDKGYSIDDLLKLCKQNIVLYNTEQQSISPRIDEVRRAMPPEMDYSQLEAGLVTARDYIRQIDERLSSSRAAALEANKKQMEIATTKNKIDNYKRSKLEEINKDVFESKLRLQQAYNFVQTAQLKINTNAADSIKLQMEEREKTRKELQDEYIQLFAERKLFAESEPEQLSEDAKICDKCGQSLPEDKLEIIKDMALRVFQSKKETELKHLDDKINSVIAKGKMAKDMLLSLQKRYDQLMEEQEKAKTALKDAQDYYLKLSEETASKEPVTDIDLTGDMVYNTMLADLEELERSIKEPEDKTDVLLASKAKLEAQVIEINKRLNGKEDREKGLKRVEELVERGQTLSGLIAFEKSRQYQAERFIRAKSEKLEIGINAMFDNISFRLFDLQINGSVIDDCTPMIHSVEYRDASNSEKIRANLDIVYAMQKYYGSTMPVFVDNAEAATYLRDMDCQMIKLIVSEPDKFLRVESI